jgi:hypothetical protein
MKCAFRWFILYNYCLSLLRAQLRWCVTGVLLVANRRRSDLLSANHCQGQLQTPQSVTVGTQAHSPVLYFRRMQSAYALVWLITVSGFNCLGGKSLQWVATEWFWCCLPSFLFFFNFFDQFPFFPLFFFSLCLLSSFPCLIFPFVVLCSPANFLSCFPTSFFYYFLLSQKNDFSH